MRLAVLALLFAVLAAGAACAQFAESGPILPSERDIATPSRDVPAQSYRDAYCATWTDGCVFCERASIHDEPKCAHEKVDATCQSHRVICKRALPTLHRVCLRYYDGCNWCWVFGECTARGCREITPTGLVAFTGGDTLCTVPRKSHYDEAHYADLRSQIEETVGLWRITASDGSSCLLTLEEGGYLSGEVACLELPEDVRHFQKFGLRDGDLVFFGKSSPQMMRFHPENFERMRGGVGGDWVLERIDAQPRGPGDWEGDWYLSVIWPFSPCHMLLGMRDVSVPDGLKAMAPGDFAMTSGCRTAGQGAESRSGFSYRLPDWTQWTLKGDTVTLLDRSGATTLLTRLPGSQACAIGQILDSAGKPHTLVASGTAHLGIYPEKVCPDPATIALPTAK